MDENAFHKWLIDCFGPVQGEAAFQQMQNLPQPIRDQMMSGNADKLPSPTEVQSLMQAFTAGGLNSLADMNQTVESGPINVRLAKSIALQQAGGSDSKATVSAEDGERIRQAMSEASLWLDTVCSMDPAPGEPQVLTRTGWVEGTLDAWAGFAAPVAASLNDALASVISERLGDTFEGEIAGMFAGPIPIPIPEGMTSPAKLMKLLGNTSFAMQLGRAAGDLSHEVRGSFDQGIALLDTPAGGLIAQNVDEFAHQLDIPVGEATSFLALQELAHARLFAGVPWLMPRFESLIGKYARGVNIDLDAMEEQLREVTSMDPESMSGAVKLTNVGIADTPEQQEAKASLETLLALVEGWVDCVTWRAGMAHIPHIEQLREMMRRERATGGPAERTFETMIGLELRPRRMREAAAIWERIGAEQGADARDAMWSHPDLLPQLPADTTDAIAAKSGDADTSEASPTTPGTSASATDGIDWDAELSKLLDANDGDASDGDANDGTDDAANNGDK